VRAIEAFQSRFRRVKSKKNCQAFGPTSSIVSQTQPFRLGFSNSIKCILNFFSRLFLRNDSFVFENDSKTRFADFDRVALSMFGFEL
jgi:hypothetical protein